jgi:hypothetical protein
MRMEAGQFRGVLGCVLWPGFHLDYFLEGLTDLLSVSLDGLSRIPFQ